MSLTAEIAAVALVAAARHVGVEPLKVFERTGRGTRRGPHHARVLAAAGVRAAMSVPNKDLARVFAVHITKVAPSHLASARVTADDLLVVADALRSRGLIDDAGANARFVKPWGPRRPQGSAPSPSPQVEAAPKSRPYQPEGCVVLKPVTPQVVKRAIDMLDARWDLAEVAGLFDVDPDALLNAIEAQG